MNVQKQKFVNAYVLSGNATSSAIEANYSAKTAYSIGCRLLKDEAIIEAIQAAQDEAKQRNRITVDDIIQELEAARKAALGADNPQCSAAISATMAKAKLLGLDKPEEDTTPKQISIHVVRAVSKVMDEITAGA